MKVPLTRPVSGKEEERAVAEVLQSGHWTSGPKTREFEEIVAEYTGARFAVSVSSCTAALHLGLLASGIKPGDKVIVPSFTFPATANAVMHAGAEPVFCDVDRETYNAGLEQSMGHKDANHAIGVSLFGLETRMPCDIEDAACALGSSRLKKEVASPRVLCYSFHPRKIITTGEGGMLVTDNETIADIVRAMRDHGKSDYPFPYFSVGGFNYRTPDILAAIGIEQMKKIDDIIDERRYIATRYHEALESTELGLPVIEGSNCQSYVVTVQGNRDVVMEKLRGQGVECTVGTYAVHRHHGLSDDDYPNSAWLADHTLTLPLYPQMTDNEFDYVVEKVKEVL